MFNRYRNYNEPLTNEELQRLAPSVYAGQAYDKMSSKYGFISSTDVLQEMRNAGFEAYSAQQSTSRVPGKELFTKHMIRFRSNLSDALKVGDTTIENIVINSHDGTSAYVSFLGVFRFACLNGLFVAKSLIAAAHIRHVGNVASKVAEANLNLLKDAPKVIDAIGQWKGIELNLAEQFRFAEKAHALRFEDSNVGQHIAIEKLLTVRRYGDNGNDLWTVFNRIQENTLRGGLRGLNAINLKRIRSREVKSIDSQVNINTGLWQVAQDIADSKSIAWA